jgi:hypothetical protein
MKKVFAVIIISIVPALSLIAQNHTPAKKLFAEFQAGPILVHTNQMSGILSEASATIGLNISSRLSAGLGISTIHFITATPYLYGKVNFADLEKRSIIPFLSVNAGYTLNFEDSATPNDRISIEPKIGLSFYGKKKKSSFIIYAGAHYYTRVLPTIGIGVGF